MGLWFRVHLGPVGYTARGRRKPQSYGAYKASRERREQYAARYDAERAAKERKAAAPPATLVRLNPGRTDPEFDGVPDETLRRWLTYWQEVTAGTREPTPDDRSFARSPEAEAAKLLAEIGARHPKSAPRARQSAEAAPGEPVAPHLRGITSSDYDGIGLPALRAFVRYHEDVAAGRRELFDYQPTWQTDAAGLVAEIEARGETVRRATSRPPV